MHKSPGSADDRGKEAVTLMKMEQAIQGKYNAVIFDLDGTLLNTLEDLKDSVNYGLKKYGMPERSLEEIRRFVGNGVQKLIWRSLPGNVTKEEENLVFSAFKEYYKIHCNDKTGLYPGIRELLEALKESGYKMAIVSNKLQSGVDTLREIYFKEYIDTAIGSREGVPKKPAPDMVLEALKRLGASKETSLYVGDSEVDIATALNTGMDCMAVAWGFRSREEQEQAGSKVFAEKPLDILQYIKS